MMRAAICYFVGQLLFVLVLLLVCCLAGCWATHVTPDGDTHLSSAAEAVMACVLFFAMIGAAFWATVKA